ncbi:20452_t:CDS:2, partial [Racocetra persica]
SVHLHWIPRDTNANPCDKLNEYASSIYSELEYLNYADVKACYESTPYDKTKAIQVIEVVKETLKGFYALLDQAREEPKPGFTFKPIDLISELDLILKKNYSYEFQFIYDVADLIGELKDGHTRLTSTNYNKYAFYQGLSLYSVIKKDGTQQIKVFDDVKDSSTIDCQVTHIDDKPAIDVITEFARNKTFFSRDLSGRFNSALASLGFGNGDFQMASIGQLFSIRNQLPKSPSISYTLNCNNKISKITREWQVPIKLKFPSLYKYKSPYITGSSVGKATLIFDAFIARFYKLEDFGVVIISTETIINNDNDLEYHFLSNIVTGFKMLAEKGIKKIILDLSNNNGGDVFAAHYINKLLFPNIKNFPVALKVNNNSLPFINEFSKLKLENLIDVNANTFDGVLFHYKSYLSTKTNSQFNNVMDFIGNNIYTRGGVQVKYTTKAFFNDTTLYNGPLEPPTPPKFPWTEKDIIILTNGLCFSACAIITQRLAEINVPTISVGGFPNNPFSYAQYAVGAATNTIAMNYVLRNVKNIDPSLISKLSFPANLTLSFTILEAYSINNPNEVMDYSVRRANYQLYYDERSARDPSSLWMQAANILKSRAH